MRLTVDHTTTYLYETPATYALQQVRKRPKSLPSQSIIHWDLSFDGAYLEASYTDHFGNDVDLISIEPGAEKVTITSRGEVDTIDTAGVTGPHRQLAPLWLFQHQTALTEPGREIKSFASAHGKADLSDVSVLHDLMQQIEEAVRYDKAQTDVALSAEDVLKLGHGVCQDHAHIFISVARVLGFPARYVSGYLMMEDRVEQDAGHAWAEVYVEGLGWTGFDVSNQICPDERYVQVAHGLDYSDASPVKGLQYGAGEENLVVTVQVQQ